MPIDIRQTTNGDIDLTGGDIHWAESTYQHQRDLLIGRKSHFRQRPGVGVGSEDFINDDSGDAFYREVRVQFNKDGMKVIKVKPNIDAKYSNS
ncbi:MAG: hypothetical protein ACK4EY_15090 [Flavipsychrobacter sp.]